MRAAGWSRNEFALYYMQALHDQARRGAWADAGLLHGLYRGARIAPDGDGQVTTGLIAEQATIVAKLNDLFQARSAKNAAGKVDNELTAVVKQWMQLNADGLDKDEKGDPYLDDGEHGIRAKLESRRSISWDLRRAPDEVVLYLARDGLLKVDNTAFEARRKVAPAVHLDDAMAYRHEGEESALRVEALK